MKRPFSAYLMLVVILLPLMAFADDKVPNDPAQIRPLLPGLTAPSFTVRRADGTDYNFDNQKLEKPVVLIFYRGGWCPYCNLYMANLRHAEPKLVEMGYEVIFVNPDRPEKLYPSLKEKDIDYTLLSDSKMEAAKAFGVAFRLDDDALKEYQKYGIDLEDASGETHHMLPVPAVFIIGTDGVIRFQYANPNYQDRLDPELLTTAATVALRQK